MYVFSTNKILVIRHSKTNKMPILCHNIIKHNIYSLKSDANYVAVEMFMFKKKKQE